MDDTGHKIATKAAISICFLLSVGLIIYIFGIHLVRYISATPPDYSPKLFAPSYIHILLTLSIIIGELGIHINRAHQRPYLKIITEISWSERFLYVTIALAFSFFYIGTFRLDTIVQRSLLTVLVPLFFFLVPRLIHFYTHVNLTYFSALVKIVQGRLTVQRAVFFTVYVMIVISTIIYITNMFSEYRGEKLAEEALNSKRLYIKTITLDTIMHAEHVTIGGYHFGWPSDQRWRLMSSDGEVGSEFWSDTSIRFVVPLHMTMGKREIWIERPESNEHAWSPTLTSNKRSITIVSRFSFWPAEGDTLLTRGVKKIKFYTYTHVGQLRSLLFGL